MREPLQCSRKSPPLFRKKRDEWQGGEHIPLYTPIGEGLHLQPIKHPHKTGLMISYVLGAVFLLTTLAAFAVEGDAVLWFGILGGTGLLTMVILIVVFLLEGKRKLKAIAELLAGKDLIAHWTFDDDEWDRYTENEYARGLKQTRTVSIWTLGITMVLMVMVGLFSDGGIDSLFAAMSLVVIGGLTALIGGATYASARATYNRNRSRVGEVYVGAAGAYFNETYHGYGARFTVLRKVALEDGDPSVVHIDYQVGAGENAAFVELRVPVPRGLEAEAQQVVDRLSAWGP